MPTAAVVNAGALRKTVWWARAGYIPEHVLLAVIPALSGSLVVERRVHGAATIAAAAVAAACNEIGGRYINYGQDLRSGVDGDAHHLPAGHPLNRGYPPVPQMYTAGAVLLVAFALVVTVLGYQIKPWLAVFGPIFLALTFNYAGGPARFGHRGLAELGRFIATGLMATGTAIAVAGRVTLAGLLVGVYFGLFAVAGMTVQNSRDHEVDRAANKTTLPVRFGRHHQLVMLGVTLPAAAAGSWLAARLGAPGAAVVAVVAAPLVLNVSVVLTSGRTSSWRYYVHPRLTVVAYLLAFAALLVVT